MKTIWVHVNYHLNCEGKSITRSNGKWFHSWSTSESVAQGLKKSAGKAEHYLVQRETEAFIIEGKVYTLLGYKGFGKEDPPALVCLGTLEEGGNEEDIRRQALEKLTELEREVLGL